MATKPTAKENAIILAGSALMMGMVFQKPLGLPEWVGDLMMLAAFVCIFEFNRRRRRAKLQGTTEPPAPSDKVARKKTLWIVVVCVAITSIIFPFIGPYLGLSLPFTELVIISVLTFVVVVSICVYNAKRQQ